MPPYLFSIFRNEFIISFYYMIFVPMYVYYL